MRIAFVTSSLEPRRDGVGDYTRLLAEECQRLGCEVRLIALHDRHLGEATIRDDQLRLSTRVPWKERAARAKRFLEDFQPHAVSLQFVCYGFDDRGLVGSISPHMIHLLEGWPVHLFFHELWVGAEVGSQWRHRLLGWLQKRAVLDLVRKLAPILVHTSNDSYRRLLEVSQVKARELPLFGSLPLPRVNPQRDGTSVHFILFGTLHPVWPFEPLLSDLRALGQPIRVTHVGHMGAGELVWREMVKVHGEVVQFTRIGPASPSAIADAMAGADFGIATTPWSIIGKSASVAAMLDAGLPVLVNRDDLHYREAPDPQVRSPRLLRTNGRISEIMATAPREQPRLSLPEVARRFVQELRETIGA